MKYAPGSFVSAIKCTIDGKIKYKDRCVIGGHKDKMKDLMVHFAATVQPQYVRLLLGLAAAFSLDVWTAYIKHTAYIKQAYLQSAEPLARQVFIEFQFRSSSWIQLNAFNFSALFTNSVMQPIYGTLLKINITDRKLK